MRILIAGLCLAFLNVLCYAQEIIPLAMRPLPNDLTGRIGEKVLDKMGRPTALVKVKVRYPGATFDGHIKSVDMGGEYYVWMEDGNYRLLMRFPGCDPEMINFKSLMGAAVKAPDTYELIIDQEALKRREENENRENVMFSLKRSPNADCVVTCNGKKALMADGKINLNLPVGTHEYRIDFGEDNYEIVDSVNVVAGALNRVEVELPLIFCVNGIRFRMIPVEGGIFTCRLSDEEVSAYRQQPFREESIDNFFIGETEVTQALWEAVTGKNPSHARPFGYADSLPVENVSWEDCIQFIKQLNRLTGLEFRLPSESEWEYAAHGGNKSKGYIYAGSDDIELFCYNRGARTYSAQGKELIGRPTPAGGWANELGLRDMTGNVWEWCEDDFRPGKSKVIKGGSWRNSADLCLPAMRYDGGIKSRYDNVGLRLTLSAGSIPPDYPVLKIAK